MTLGRRDGPKSEKCEGLDWPRGEVNHREALSCYDSQQDYEFRSGFFISHNPDSRHKSMQKVLISCSLVIKLKGTD